MRRGKSIGLRVGGCVLCCLAAVQISQLLDGRAAPDLWNYGLTFLTTVSGLGVSTVCWLVPAEHAAKSAAAVLQDQRPLVAAIDLLFAHFRDDPTAQEAVRVVARSVTEKRYRADS